MTRNREATSARIVEAVGHVLAREGFRGLSLRAVARQAGVDKRLLSRYFGDLDRLIAAYAAGSDFWWTVDELVGDHLPGPAENTWAGWLCLAVQRHTGALRQRALTQEILAWEMIEPNALTEELSAVREQRAAELIERIQARLGTQADASWRAVGALMAAATTYLIVRAHTCDFYLGIDLHAEDSWKQFDRAIEIIARGAIAEPPPRRDAAALNARSQRKT
ncbi:MAG: TetR/AcrR family transcriptional regulator [Deltaproteobacteria bacterium]|nr:TetR/AcrR family transcriptional regulator [Deltaproteobacteria bacterium]